MQRALYKIWLVSRSEYLRRVRSRAFLLATLLVPLGFVIVAAAPGILGLLADQGTHHTVAVVDRTDRLGGALAATSDDRLTFRPTEEPIASVQQAVRNGRYDGYLLLPASLFQGTGEATYYATEGGNLTDKFQIDQRVSRVVQEERLRAVDASASVLSILESDVSVANRTLREGGTAADHSLMRTAIGYALALIVYLAVFIYGQYVMQGVVEEKSNRVVEIIVSSVRPFELLMGKVLGIGAMGLTQMVLWVLLVAGGFAAATPMLSLAFDPSALGGESGPSAEVLTETLGVSLPPLPASLIVWFILFFVGGFLLYASLFAAVGSAVERQQDAQSLQFPVLIPLLLPVLLLAFVLESPHSTISIVLSLIPFFSPIIMMLRVAVTSVPFWQLATAYGLLIVTFAGTIWVAGRIYRVGILSYGTTPTVREVLRWITYR